MCFVTYVPPTIQINIEMICWYVNQFYQVDNLSADMIWAKLSEFTYQKWWTSLFAGNVCM